MKDTDSNLNAVNISIMLLLLIIYKHLTMKNGLKADIKLYGNIEERVKKFQLVSQVSILNALKIS